MCIVLLVAKKQKKLCKSKQSVLGLIASRKGVVALCSAVATAFSPIFFSRVHAGTTGTFPRIFFRCCCGISSKILRENLELLRPELLQELFLEFLLKFLSRFFFFSF